MTFTEDTELQEAIADARRAARDVLRATGRRLDAVIVIAELDGDGITIAVEDKELAPGVSLADLLHAAGDAVEHRAEVVRIEDPDGA